MSNKNHSNNDTIVGVQNETVSLWVWALLLLPRRQVVHVQVCKDVIKPRNQKWLAIMELKYNNNFYKVKRKAC